AIACGTPFVASRVGGIPEIAHLGQGQLVPPGNAEMLAQALKDTLDTPVPLAEPPRPRGHEEAAAELIDIFEETVTAYRAPVGLRGSQEDVGGPPRGSLNLTTRREAH